MNTNNKRLFLDSGVIIAALTESTTATKILTRTNLYSNEYCVREVRWYLEKDLELPPHKINSVLDYLRSKVTIVSTPSINEFKKLILPKKLKSDAPVLQGAINLNATLVTYDNPLMKEAKKYCETTKPEEIVNI